MAVHKNKHVPSGASCQRTDKHVVLSVKVLAWTFVVTVVVFAGLGWYTWRSYTEFIDAEKDYNKLLVVEGQIIYYDNILTMSAQMAAATGDPAWEEYYKSIKPQLDSAIKSAIALAPRHFMAEAAARTDVANARLAVMDDQAFELVRRGMGQEALALLQGREHQEQKSIFANGMQRYIHMLGRYIKVHSNEYQLQVLGEIAFVGFLVLVTVFSGFCILQMLRRIAVSDRAERVVRIAYKELEASNDELTRMQSHIVQSEKLASIGQLAAGVAHEMNTPVGFVASNFQTLENYVEKIEEMLGAYGQLIEEIKAKDEIDLLKKANVVEQMSRELKIDFILEDIQGLFDDSREGLERVASIVQNLRDFSRIDQPGSTDEYDFNRGVEATLVVAKNEIKYSADVKTEFDEVPTTRCHAGQINQVVLNILLNAVQAIQTQGRKDKGTITVRTYATDKEVICEISDDGPGISEETLPHIFDPFFTTKPVGKGTGLGLSVSYDIIVHKNDGKLLVKSKVGEGTTFTIRLPIRREEINNNIEVESNGYKNGVVCR